jgi:hypothetical protein
MRALEKDRTRRYEAASGLARDIQRYLRNEPVEARPPSQIYRFQKMVRRNKLAFAAGAAVIAALLLGLGVSTWLLIQERKARHRADEAEKVQTILRQQAEHRSELGQKIGISALHVTQGKYDQAERELGPVPVSELTNFAATASLFNAFAEVHARHGEWPEAISNLSKVIAVVPADFPAYPARALLQAQMGDRESWRQDCEEMLRRFGSTDDPVIAARVADVCLILPPPDPRQAGIAKIVSTALTANSPEKTWNDAYFAKALALYRLGDYSAAIEFVQKVSLEKSHSYRTAAARTLLSMAQRRLGQPSDPRVAISDPKNGLGDQWLDWVMAHLLIEEAR